MIPDDEIATEPDRVPPALLWITAIVTAAAIAGSALAVWLIAGKDPYGGGATSPAGVIPPEIDAVTTEPFELVLGAEHRRADQARALDHWSWRDRAHRIVRVPVSVAIDLYLSEMKK